MNIRFDFAVHWLFAVVYALLVFSGITMIGARFGWLLQYDIALADYVHRIAAVFFAALTLVYIGYEVLQIINGTRDKRPWGLFKPRGFGAFNLVITLGLTLSGVILWKSHHANQAALAFAMFVHEKLTYIALAGVIWHIYQKAHILIWPRQRIAGNLMTEPGFKLFIWVLATAYVFSAAAVVISLAGPEPGNAEVQRFMAGMNRAMESSLMGLANADAAITPALGISALLVVETFLLVLTVSVIVLQRKGSQ